MLEPGGDCGQQVASITDRLVALFGGGAGVTPGHVDEVAQVDLVKGEGCVMMQSGGRGCQAASVARGAREKAPMASVTGPRQRQRALLAFIGGTPAARWIRCWSNFRERASTCAWRRLLRPWWSALSSLAAHSGDAFCLHF